MSPVMHILFTDGDTVEAMALDALIAINVEAEDLEGAAAQAWGDELRTALARDGFMLYGGGAAGASAVYTRGNFEYVRESVGEPADTVDSLTDAYEVWTRANNLPLISADDHDPTTLTPEQATWVEDFQARWEAAEARS